MKPASLSGGMRKRVGLARAIAMDPQYILYDEPTTGLDPIMADVINQLIRAPAEAHGRDSMVVTHDMTSAFKVGDRIAMLHEGTDRVHADTPEETREHDGSAGAAVHRRLQRRARSGLPAPARDDDA